MQKPLYNIFKGTTENVGVTMEDFASCTTGSGLDAKIMAVNYAKYHDVLWGWCFAHHVYKVGEHALGTAASLAAPKNPVTREVIQRVIKVVKNIHKLPLGKRPSSKASRFSYASML